MSFFPIPFAKSCKGTLTGQPFYFQFTFRAYAPGTEVPLAGKLGTDEEQSVALPGGTRAVRDLAIKLGSYADPEITRKVVLKIEFDGQEAVWCPMGGFFGCGIRLNPFQDWYRTVAKDGMMSCRWVMPYRKSGEISVVNLSGTPVDFQLGAKVGDWKWDESSLYFNAAWRTSRVWAEGS